MGGAILSPNLIDQTAHAKSEPIIHGRGRGVLEANHPAVIPITNRSAV